MEPLPGGRSIAASQFGVIGKLGYGGRERFRIGWWNKDTIDIVDDSLANSADVAANARQTSRSGFQQNDFERLDFCRQNNDVDDVVQQFMHVAPLTGERDG